MREAGRIEPITRCFDVDPFDFFLLLCQLPWQDLSQKRLRSLLGAVQGLSNRSQSSTVSKARYNFGQEFFILRHRSGPACSGEELLDI
jgi:hypothetical protein